MKEREKKNEEKKREKKGFFLLSITVKLSRKDRMKRRVMTHIYYNYRQSLVFFCVICVPKNSILFYSYLCRRKRNYYAQYFDMNE
jgi:hypothetical protein